MHAWNLWQKKFSRSTSGGSDPIGSSSLFFPFSSSRWLWLINPFIVNYHLIFYSGERELCALTWLRVSVKGVCSDPNTWLLLLQHRAVLYLGMFDYQLQKINITIISSSYRQHVIQKCYLKYLVKLMGYRLNSRYARIFIEIYYFFSKTKE